MFDLANLQDVPLRMRGYHQQPLPGIAIPFRNHMVPPVLLGHARVVQNGRPQLPKLRQRRRHLREARFRHFRRHGGGAFRPVDAVPQAIDIVRWRVLLRRSRSHGLPEDLPVLRFGQGQMLHAVENVPCRWFRAEPELRRGKIRHFVHQPAFRHLQMSDQSLAVRIGRRRRH